MLAVRYDYIYIYVYNIFYVIRQQTVKQRLKCNTGKVCNYLIQFLLSMVHGKRILL
jgi:hypothetical protein